MYNAPRVENSSQRASVSAATNSESLPCPDHFLGTEQTGHSEAQGGSSILAGKERGYNQETHK